LTHEQAIAELARAHVHVMPSSRDGFGVAHIEAMGAGLPTVGGKGTGAEDIARVGEGAIFVRPGQVGELTGVLESLLSDESRRQALGKAAQKTVFEHFSWQTNGRRTAEIYREVAQPRP
jgi:glycosyltransferase involved in cell wall biosynthesis